MFVLNGNQERVIEALGRCGLSPYEGRVMFTLQMTGEFTAWNLAKKSGVPQSKIYYVIYKMEEKKLVKIVRRDPMSVKAIALGKYLDRLQKTRQRQTEKDGRQLGRIIRKLKPCFDPYDRYMRIFAPKYNDR